MRRPALVSVLSVIGLTALVSIYLHVPSTDNLIRAASADQTFPYTGGPFDVGRLSDELATAGISAVTIRGSTSEIEVVVADGVAESAVAAVVTAHDPVSLKSLDLILVRRNAANDGLEIGRVGGTWKAWDPDFVQSTRKGADQTNTTTTLADVGGLQFPVAPEKVYDFVFRIYYTAAAGTTGLVLTLDGPASPADLIFAGEVSESATARRGGVGVSYGQELVGQNSGGAARMYAELRGTIQTGAAGGTLKVRFRSEVDGSGVTILRGSSGELKS